MSLFTTDYQGLRTKAKALLTTAFTPSVWAKSTAYAENTLVRPTVANGHYYRCTQAGTSGASAPTWPTTFWTTVVDGGCIWRQEEPVTVADYDPVDFSYPSLVVGDIKMLSEMQFALGNQPSPELFVDIGITTYQGKTTKTWQQMRLECFDVLKQVQHVVRTYPSLDGYTGVLWATSGVYSLPEMPAVFYRVKMLWLLKLIVKR